MCETLHNMFCCIVADNYVVNSGLQHIVVKCVLWALRQGGK